MQRSGGETVNIDTPGASETFRGDLEAALCTIAVAAVAGGESNSHNARNGVRAAINTAASQVPQSNDATSRRLASDREQTRNVAIATTTSASFTVYLLT